jgi:hypothetical protein
MNMVGQDKQRPGQDFNSDPPKIKSGLPTTRPRRSWSTQPVMWTASLTDAVGLWTFRARRLAGF